MSPVVSATKNMWKARLGAASGWLASILTLLRLCPHDWRDVKEVKVFHYEGDKMPAYTKYVQRCELCKKYRSFKI